MKYSLPKERETLISKKSVLVVLTVLIIGVLGLVILGCQDETDLSTNTDNENSNSISEQGDNTKNSERIVLPDPEESGDMSVEEAIASRRSVRTYQESALDLNELSQLLWAAQGITDESSNYRSAPSAGATYPMEVYVIAGKVEELSEGIYKYNPKEHELRKIINEDITENLMENALGQSQISEASLNIVVTAVYERVTGRYDERGIRYSKMEAGHISQNIYLQSTALGLGTVAIGAFDDDGVSELLQLDKGEDPMYIMPIGRQ